MHWISLSEILSLQKDGRNYSYANINYDLRHPSGCLSLCMARLLQIYTGNNYSDR